MNLRTCFYFLAAFLLTTRTAILAVEPQASLREDEKSGNVSGDRNSYRTSFCV